MTATTLTKFCIEHPIPTKAFQKESFYHDESYSRIKGKGFHSHLLAPAHMRMLAAYLTGTLAKEHYSAAADMIKGNELLDTAVRAEGDLLYIFDHPRLKHRCQQYEPQTLIHLADDVYDISGLPKGEPIAVGRLARKDLSLVARLWSANPEELPKDMAQNAYLVIPREGVWPLATSNDMRYGLVPALRAASRGMRVESEQYKARPAYQSDPVAQDYALAASR